MQVPERDEGLGDACLNSWNEGSGGENVKSYEAQVILGMMVRSAWATRPCLQTPFLKRGRVRESY